MPGRNKAGRSAMAFLRRWLTGSLGMALGLLMAVLAMQAPALTHDYAAALLQVAREARRDADQRLASARQFYTVAGEGEDEVIGALRLAEPSNAETLAAALGRARRLQAGYDRIAAARPLLQPLVALWQAMDDERGDQAILRRTLLESYTPQLSLSVAAGIYGLAGLLLGTLAAQLALALLAAVTRLMSARRRLRRYVR
jgi:hypothetical protein